jgi:adenylate cyclase
MAIADDPGSSEVLGYAGCALSDLGHSERGAEILRQAFEMDPSNAQAEVALGAALALFGDLDAGIARMRHGIKLIPRLVDQDPWAQLRRPMDMIRQG